MCARSPVVSGADVRGAVQALQAYSCGSNDLGISDVDDKLLRRLLKSMLNISPEKRPNIGAVLSSLYMLSP